MKAEKNQVVRHSNALEAPVRTKYNTQVNFALTKTKDKIVIALNTRSSITVDMVTLVILPSDKTILDRIKHDRVDKLIHTIENTSSVWEITLPLCE